MFKHQRQPRYGNTPEKPFLAITKNGSIVPNKSFMDLINKGILFENIMFVENNKYTSLGNKNPYYDHTKPTGIYVISQNESEEGFLNFRKGSALSLSNLDQLFFNYERRNRKNTFRWFVDTEHPYYIDGGYKAYRLDPKPFDKGVSAIIKLDKLNIQNRAIRTQKEFDIIQTMIDHHTRYGSRGGKMTFKELGEKINVSPDVIGSVNNPNKYKQYRQNAAV